MRKFKGLDKPSTKVGGFSFDKKGNIITKGGEKVMYQAPSVLKMYSECFGDIIPKGDILFVGLGSGLMYNEWKNDEGVTSFEAIEIDKEIIDINIGLGNDMIYHNVSAFDFKSDKKYDIIILDIFHKKVKDYEKLQEQLFRLYQPMLKEDGILRYLKICSIDLDYLL